MTWKLSSCERPGEARASQTDRQTGLPWLAEVSDSSRSAGTRRCEKHLDPTDLPWQIVSRARQRWVDQRKCSTKDTCGPVWAIQAVIKAKNQDGKHSLAFITWVYPLIKSPIGSNNGGTTVIRQNNRVWAGGAQIPTSRQTWPHKQTHTHTQTHAGPVVATLNVARAFACFFYSQSTKNTLSAKWWRTLNKIGRLGQA